MGPPGYDAVVKDTYGGNVVDKRNFFGEYIPTQHKRHEVDPRASLDKLDRMFKRTKKINKKLKKSYQRIKNYVDNI